MISIVTGTLNRRELLPILIENTVLASGKLELVLVDGGSEDGTVDYIKDLGHERIQLIEVGARSSYPHYMNLGIKAANNDWIAQWNDDVVLLDDWRAVLKELEEDYDLYIFRWTRRPKDKLFVPKEDETWIRYDGCMNFGIYHRRVFRKIGLYDSRFYYYHCDQDMTQRALSFNMRCKLSDVRVCEIKTEKKAVGEEKKDNKLIRGSLRSYRRGKIPRTVEFLD